MEKYNKILVAYDGSHLSERSLQQAIEMVTDNPEKELYVVSVVNYQTGAMTNAVMYNNIKKEIVEEMEQAMTGVKDKLNNLPIKSNVELLDGNPGKTISAYAKDKQIDLIIMGSRGLGGIKEVFLGSVSHEVLKHAHCPVLIIK